MCTHSCVQSPSHFYQKSLQGLRPEVPNASKNTAGFLHISLSQTWAASPFLLTTIITTFQEDLPIYKIFNAERTSIFCLLFKAVETPEKECRKVKKDLGIAFLVA